MKGISAWGWHLAAVSLSVLFAIGSSAMTGIAPSPVVETTQGGNAFRLVRTVSSPYGGTIDLVTIPEDKQRDRQYYRDTAETVCGTRATCLVKFWVEGSRVPTSASMPVADLQTMTATYERHPSYEAPHLKLACWLYSARPAGPDEDCFVMPGLQVPREP
jgi:hypothetical protein